MQETIHPVYLDFNQLVSEIDSGKKRYSLLIGSNISFSLSARIHSLIYQSQRILDQSYLIYDSNLSNQSIFNTDKILSLFKKDNVVGMNLTTPYKTLGYPNSSKVVSNIEEGIIKLEPTTKKLYSVNTLYKLERKIYSTTTDILGLESSLKKSGYQSRLNSFNSLVILGSGGMSRTILEHLNYSESNSSVFVLSRTKPDFLDEFHSSKIKINYYPLGEDSLDEIFSKNNLGKLLIINSLLKNVDTSWTFLSLGKLTLANKDRICFMDLNYDGSAGTVLEYEKIFLDRENIRFIDGMDMLIAQAIYSQILWNDLKIKNQDFLSIHQHIKENLG